MTAPTAQPRPAPLRFLVPGWYAIVMGLCGLALAWQRAVPMMGEIAGAATLPERLLPTLFILVAPAGHRRPGPAAARRAAGRGLRDGTLLAPEPVAVLAPAT